ncbi:MAG: PaaI family thioesterase [Silicimonas sp.]|jgi:uncharacterized protein (TIGR00369 family)|nr:PaaI family thioesterase [Silicimonas sp.]
MSIDPEIEAKVRASFSQQGLMASFGAELLSVDAGRVVIAAPVKDEVSQQHGAVHAGLTFALGDSAAGYSALTLLAGETEVMTVEMKINLLRPGLGTRLVAEGGVVKAGRRLSVVRAEVFAEGDGGRKLIALLQGTMVPV